MTVLYVAGARPGVGSTAVAASLAAAWRRAGRNAVADKPLALAKGTADAALLAQTTSVEASEPGVVAPDGTVEQKALAAAAKRIEALGKGADVVVVDGLPHADADARTVEASGVLAKRLRAKVVGVLPYERTLTAAAVAPWREAYGDALVGFVVNRQTRYAVRDAGDRLVGELAAEGTPALGVLREERLMLAPTVRQVVELLDGTLFAGASGLDRLVEHFLIGGLITEWGGNYFNRLPNQAVIARGGRADIQMSALNFPLNVLVLTGCSQPPQYVQQRAESLDVPLITVGRNTHETAEALEALAGQVTVHHADKIERFTAMVEERVDWDALNKGMALDPLASGRARPAPTRQRRR